MFKSVDIYRILATFTLVVALLFQTFPKSLVMLDYYLNTNAYAAYCVNKDKPEMQCNGMCQMDEMMNELDHHHKHQESTEAVVSVYLIPQAILFTPENFTLSSEKLLFYYPEIELSNYTFSFFHPPQFKTA